MTETFTVSDDQLMAQLVQGCGYDSTNSHLLWSDLRVSILTADGMRTARQVQWYLHTHHWIDEVYDTCGNAECVDLAHLTVSKAERDQHRAQRKADQDQEDLLLVQRNAVSLADLYRKGKARGLIGPSGGYGG